MGITTGWAANISTPVLPKVSAAIHLENPPNVLNFKKIQLGVCNMELTYVKKILGGIMLGCLLLIAACATTHTTTGPTHPKGPEYDDPMFWQMWQDQRGLG
jgi:hypothetical protein